MPDDHLDVPLEDPEQLGEVSLLADVMVASSASPGRLSQREIDRLLGLTDASG